MIAIPAIDLIDNQIVRLFQGDYSKCTFYPKSSQTYANELEQFGFEFLHLVDLSGAKIGSLVHTQIMEEIAKKTSLKIDFGGGISKEEDVIELFEKGANQVVIGSLCVKNPSMVKGWLQKYGAEKFVLALDTDGTHLKISGWQEETKTTIQGTLTYFNDFNSLHILSTDIRRDGTGKGPSVALYTQLIRDFPQHRWIASGGVESLSDLEKLRDIGCYACVIGKAILDGKISLKELANFNLRKKK
jgi:phosphoribosylformimino-5-aminoimidazole carboxamide ribotide isomerase